MLFKWVAFDCIAKNTRWIRRNKLASKYVKQYNIELCLVKYNGHHAEYNMQASSEFRNASVKTKTFEV